MTTALNDVMRLIFFEYTNKKYWGKNYTFKHKTKPPVGASK